MHDLWSILGYDSKIAEIATSLSSNTDIALVSGPPGSGKSWMAAGVGVQWDLSGGSTVLVQGDIFRSEVALFPFSFAMANLSSAWRAAFSGLGGIARASEARLHTNGIISATVDAANRARKARRRGFRLVLGEDEQRIIHELERLGRKRPLLVIADNVHWWDAKSLEFLDRLQDRRMWESYGFLRELRVLAIETPEPYQHQAHPAVFSAAFPASRARKVKLDRPTRAVFPAVLEGLGAGPEVSQTLADEVFALTGGHLALAGRCAARIAEGDVIAITQAADSQEFLGRLLAERVTTLGARGSETLSALQIAAVLGLTFRRRELLCMLEGDMEGTSKILRDCRSEALLQYDSDLGSFVHDMYRQYFLTAGPLDLVSVHEKLMVCLQNLQPGRYDMRAVNASKAERDHDAAVLAVQAALQMRREGRSWRDLPSGVLEIIGESISIVEILVRAYDHLDRYQFTECLDACSRADRTTHRNIAAEIDYVRASCLMVTRSDADRATARAVLAAWSGLELEEPELGMRLMNLRIFGYAMAKQREDGIQLESEMHGLLAARMEFDQDARDGWYISQRCSGRLHVPERALLATREAVEYFAPTSGYQEVRRPMEYYRALVNYVANLIGNARYADAIEAHRSLAELIAAYAPGTFPRIDYVLMNRLQAEYRLGLITAGDAVVSLRQVINDHEVDGDPFYVENALAVYFVLAGKFEEAATTFEAIERRLQRIAEPEPSQEYLVRANECAFRFVSGDLSAREDWSELQSLTTRIPYVIGPYLVRRHELLGRAMESSQLSASEFDECLLVSNGNEYGPFWRQLARGFRLPEVEWWR